MLVDIQFMLPTYSYCSADDSLGDCRPTRVPYRPKYKNMYF